MPDDLGSDPLRTLNSTAQPANPSTIDVTSELKPTPEVAKKSFDTQNAPLKIPGFEVTAAIAKGGMGCVYSARDLTLAREVAIKTLLPGSDDARFVKEAQFTGRLPHPNIPPVHSLGKLPTGAPYLVMKLVRGQTLAELLKQRSSPQADLPRFIQIFEQIAQAVGFAHAQRIIHRDLKPLNVMVGAFGEVQVMDWGLAKELQPADGDANATTDASGLLIAGGDEATRAGAVMGTPGYMAPEQARGETVDARADVFALGAVLATVLTGRPAFVGTSVRETISKSAAADLSDVLVRVANCGADAELLAICRHCLAASAADRPADAQVVAAEIAAYRASVEARLQQAETDRARAETRAAEQTKRRRTLQWASSLVATVLLLGIVGTTWGFITARQRAEGEATAKKTAERKQQEAERNLAFAKKGNQILGSVFNAIDPNANYATVGEFSQALKTNLRSAAQQLQEGSIGDPVIVSEMQNTLGLSMMALGEFADAIKLLETSHTTMLAEVGPDNRATLTSMSNLASAYYRAGEFDKALTLYQQTLAKQQAELGPRDWETLVTMGNLASAAQTMGHYDLAIRLFSESIEIQKKQLGLRDTELLKTMSNLGVTYLKVGNVGEAKRIFEDVLQIRTEDSGPEHTETLIAMNNLASAYRQGGEVEKAIPLMERSVDLTTRRLGGEHPETMEAKLNLAVSLHTARDFDQSILILEPLINQLRAKLGDDNPHTFSAMNNLASSYKSAGRVEAAIPLIEQAQKLTIAKLGPEHPAALQTTENLTIAYCETAQWDRALPFLETLWPLMQKVHGAGDRRTLSCMHSLAVTLRELRMFDQAFELFEENLRLRRLNLGSDDADTLSAMHHLGDVYRTAGRFAPALALHEEALRSATRAFGADDPRTIACQQSLGLTYQATGKLDDALGHLEESTRRAHKLFGPDDARTLTTVDNLGAALQEAGKVDLAIPLFKENLKRRSSVLGPNHQDSLLSLARLAWGFKTIRNYEEALPLLEKTVQLCEENLGSRHPHTIASVENLMAGYVEAGSQSVQRKNADQAKAIYSALVKLQRKKIPNGDPRFPHLLLEVARQLILCGQHAAAEEHLRECLTVRELTQPEEWSTFETQSVLGGVLLAQKKYEAAEAALIAGYDGLKERESLLPKGSLLAAVDRLIEFYTAVEQPERAEKFRKLRPMD